nr:fibronectin type III domain-containing protein [uncultured Blautia sp.]
MKQRHIILSTMLAAAILASSNATFVQAAEDFSDFSDVQIEEETDSLDEAAESPDIEEADLEDGNAEEIQEEGTEIFSDSAQTELFSDGTEAQQGIQTEEGDTPEVGSGVTFTYTTDEATAAFLREQVKKHQSEVRVVATFDNREALDLNIGYRTWNLLQKHTGKSTEGDTISNNTHTSYTMRQRTEESGHVTDDGWVTTQKYIVTVDYQFEYKSTYAEDQETDAKIKQVLSSLNLANQSDYTKAKKIYDYLCNNVSFYKDAYYCANPNGVSNTAYGALVKGVTSSWGFAEAFYRIALEAGLDARIVMGDGDGSGTHEWNIVKIGRVYYHLDASVGAYPGISSSSYFLKKNLWNGIDDWYKKMYMPEDYPMASADYKPQTEISKPADVKGVKIAGRTSNAITLSWNKNTSASGYIIEQKQNGKWTSIKKISGNSTVTYRVENLSAGRYYDFRIKAFIWNNDTKTSVHGNYTNVTGATTLPKVAGVRIGSRTSNAITLNWNKSTAASGYVIEQKQNGKWTNIKKISGNSTVTYRVANLSAGKSYDFRVKAFTWDNTTRTSVHSDYANVTGATILPKVSGVKIKSRTSNAITLGWNRSTAASGYIIEQKQNGKWVNIKKISGNTTVTIRVANLKAGTKYDFRIKAFTWDNTTRTSVHSDYTNISSTTMK